MNDKQRKLERYRELNRDAKKGQIVCAGSSLMEMFPVEKFAAEAGEPVIVYNRGIGGFVTSELLDALDICILDLEPSRLFINIGTNDLSDAQIPISRMMRNYEEILERTRQALPEIEIYLMAYYPVNYEAAAEEMKPCASGRMKRSTLPIRKSKSLLSGAGIAISTSVMRSGMNGAD